VHFGLSIFPTEYSISMVDLGRAVEERGFESLWVAEHTHIPVSRRSPWPGGAELPKMYFDTLDPFVALTAAAIATTRIRVATGICLIVERDPIHTAKLVTSLDQVSGGRFMLGIGGGWNLEEMENHGTRPERRFKLMRERVEAMKAIWTQDEAEYHGELVDFDPIYMWPKPIQKPHPPIHVGGGFPGGARRAIRYGDGWMPIGGRDGDISGRLAQFHEMARSAGRSPETLEVSIYAAEPKESTLARHREAGITRVVLMLPPAPRDQILPILDDYAKLMSSVA
jgi:probable F420-dependent oxidoreductase